MRLKVLYIVKRNLFIKIAVNNALDSGRSRVITNKNLHFFPILLYSHFILKG